MSATLNPNHVAPLYGVRQFCGQLAEDVVALTGLMVRRRWSGRLLVEMDPIKRHDKFTAEPGDLVFLWGPSLDETEPVRVVSLVGMKLVVDRATRRRCRDGAVQVVAE